MSFNPYEEPEMKELLDLLAQACDLLAEFQELVEMINASKQECVI